MKSKTLVAGSVSLLCLAAIAGIAIGKAKETAVVVDQQPAISGTGSDKNVLTTSGHIVTKKPCYKGRLVKLLRTDSAGNIQTEGNVGTTRTAPNGTFTVTGELKSTPKSDDRALVMVKKSRRPDGSLKCRGARSALLIISGGVGGGKP